MRSGRIARVGFVIAWFLLIGADLGAGQAAVRTWAGAVDMTLSDAESTLIPPAPPAIQRRRSAR
jgi:hypothetical protein